MAQEQKSKTGWLERRRARRDEKKRKRAVWAANKQREAGLMARREGPLPGRDAGERRTFE